MIENINKIDDPFLTTIHEGRSPIYETFSFKDLKADLATSCKMLTDGEKPFPEAFGTASFSSALSLGNKIKMYADIKASDCSEALEKVKELFNSDWCQFKQERTPEAFAESIKAGLESNCISQVAGSYNLMTMGLCFIGAATCAYGIWKCCQSYHKRKLV